MPSVEELREMLEAGDPEEYGELKRKVDALQRRAQSLRRCDPTPDMVNAAVPPEKRPALAQELDQLANVVGTLQDVVRQVEDRFAPVLRCDVSTAGPDETDAQRPQHSEVVLFLWDRRLAISGLIERLERILERSEL